MKAEVDKKFRIILNEKEALWLKAVVQNPMYDDESEEDEEMRKKFWNALNTLTKIN